MARKSIYDHHGVARNTEKLLSDRPPRLSKLFGIQSSVAIVTDGDNKAAIEIIGLLLINGARVYVPASTNIDLQSLVSLRNVPTKQFIV